MKAVSILILANLLVSLPMASGRLGETAQKPVEEGSKVGERLLQQTGSATIPVHVDTVLNGAVMDTKTVNIPAPLDGQTETLTLDLNGDGIPDGAQQVVTFDAPDGVDVRMDTPAPTPAPTLAPKVTSPGVTPGGSTMVLTLNRVNSAGEIVESTVIKPNP